MDKEFTNGSWYEIILPYGKKFTAQYVLGGSSGREEWFYFSDGSGKLVKDIVPFAVEINKKDNPHLERSIIDFLDDEEDV